MPEIEPLTVEKTDHGTRDEIANPDPSTIETLTHSKRKLAADEDIGESDISTKKARHGLETQVTDVKDGLAPTEPVEQCSKISSAQGSDEVNSVPHPVKADSSDADVTVPAPPRDPPGSQPLTLLDNIDMTQTCLSEEQVGIRKYINPNLPTFSAILKHRFTDFLVHEVDKLDQVVHLKDISDPRKKSVPDPEQATQAKPPVMNEWPSDADEKLLGILSDEKLALLKAFVAHGPPKGKNVGANKKPQSRHASSSKTKRHPEKVSSETADVSKSKAPEQQPEGKADSVETSDVKPPEINISELIDEKDKQETSNTADVGKSTAPEEQPQNKADGVQLTDVEPPKSVISDPIDEKDKRKLFHQTIREVFKGRLLTEHKELEGDSSAIEITWGRPGKNAERRPKVVDVNPPYIHFTLQKTNRETQEALSMISRSLHCHVSRDLGICGTKDKRSVSCQRVSFKRGRRTIEDVWSTINNIRRNQKPEGGITFNQRGDKGIRLGDFTYESGPLKLGQLNGNRFIVVLRDVVPAEPEVLKEAVRTLATRGFLNYFGMQRFGTTAVGTHLVGLSLLRGDWDLAIDLIMRKKLGETQDAELARSVWAETKNAKTVLDLMPRRCVAERCILQFYSKQTGHTDKCGALASIPKNLKMMYIHAYQSYLWNTILSERVELFGCDKPVIGDLVQVDKTEALTVTETETDLEAIEDEEIVSNEQKRLPTVKVLKTIEDCEAYTIYDVVLPLVGYKIIYPENELGQRYLTMMKQDGLDPEKLYRSQAEYSMAGTYRKIMHLPKDVTCHLYEYEDPDVSLTQADEDALLGMQLPSVKEWTSETNKQTNMALKVEFTLGSSAYATMALREILKSDTGKEAQSRMTQRMRERMNGSQVHEPDAKE